jgi:hypothetical protein
MLSKQDDIDAVVTLLRDSEGFPDLTGLRAIRHDSSMVPTEQPEAAAVALTSIRYPIRINALANTAGISFEPIGLTIVYGYNGAGKSGYARNKFFQTKEKRYGIIKYQ